MSETLRWGRVSQSGTYEIPEKTSRNKDASLAGPCTIEGNGAGTCETKWHTADTAGSQDVPAPEMENPGPLAGGTGAISKRSSSVLGSYSKARANAMSRYAKARHKRVARMVGYCLTAGDPQTWGGLSAVITVRLTPLEVASLAFAALRALEPAERELVLSAAQWGQA